MTILQRFIRRLPTWAILLLLRDQDVRELRFWAQIGPTDDGDVDMDAVQRLKRLGLLQQWTLDPTETGERVAKEYGR